MKRIVCFHLFNDYSGSPKVLRMVLEGVLNKGYRVDLVSSKGGVLDELLHYPNLRKHSYPYRFSSNGAVTMLRYGLVQLFTFFLSFRWMFCKDVVFYINTLLPVGPALAGRLMGKRVVYHYHENAFVKGAFYKMLAAMMERLAHRIVCVSEYQASFLKRKETPVGRRAADGSRQKSHASCKTAGRYFSSYIKCFEVLEGFGKRKFAAWQTS